MKFTKNKKNKPDDRDTSQQNSHLLFCKLIKDKTCIFFSSKAIPLRNYFLQEERKDKNLAEEIHLWKNHLAVIKD